MCVCLMLVAPAHSKPPGSLGFKRIDELEAALTVLLKVLKEREEFEAKARPEKLVILLKRGVKEFEKKKLTGALVIEALLLWNDVDRTTPTEGAKRALGLLPAALHARYGGYKASKTRRRERHRASTLLVAALDHEHFHIRKAAIDSLKSIHGSTRGYDPSAAPRERRRVQKNWRRVLR